MKRFLYLPLVALALVASSCRKHTVEVIVVPSGEEETSTGDPMPIQLGANLKLAAHASTKSLGTIGSEWNLNQMLYVYAIPRVGRNAAANATAPLAMDEVFIDNIPADSVPVDGTGAPLENKDAHAINVYRVPGEPYYYDEDRRYEFFGYYVDDASQPGHFDATTGKPLPNNDGEKISLPIRIDGSQDVMAAWTNKEKDNTAELNENRLYSAYAARKGVYPNLIFRHMLSRFDVYIKTGDAVPLNQKLHMTRMKIQSKTDGELVIARKNHTDDKPVMWPQNTPAPADTAAWLSVWRRWDETNAIEHPHKVGRADDIRPQLDWGYVGTVMTIPGDGTNDYGKVFDIVIGFQQDGYTIGDPVGEVVTQMSIDFRDLLLPSQDPKGTYDEDDDDKVGTRDGYAQSGHRYDVNIVVYGLQEVKISVTLTPWVNAGSFLLDPDAHSELRELNVSASDQTIVVGTEGNLHPTLIVTDGLTFTDLPLDDPRLIGVEFSYDVEDTNIVEVDANGHMTAKAIGDTHVLISAVRYEVDNEGNYVLDDTQQRIIQGYGSKTIRVFVTAAPPADPNISIIGLAPGSNTITYSAATTTSFDIGVQHDGTGEVTYRISNHRALDGTPLIDDEVITKTGSGRFYVLRTGLATVTCNVAACDGFAAGSIEVEVQITD